MRKKIFYLFGISILLFLGSMYYLPALAADSEKVMITGDVVNVREFPGTSNTIITQVRKGETFSVENYQDDWYEIKLSSGQKGWIANWLAEPVHSNKTAAKNAKITVDHLNVRSEGDLTGSIIGQLNQGDNVKVFERKKDWSRISYGDGYAWVSNKYLEVQQTSTTVSTATSSNHSAVSILYDGTNIRSKPSMNSKIVESASSGEVFKIIEKTGDWYKIEYSTGKTGFVASWIVSHATDGKISKVSKKGLAGKTIVLDPGHGGRDQGAKGTNGTLEKDLTLSTAKLLAKKLEAAGVNVILTRSKDEYVSLHNRIHHPADAFISLHYDSINDKSINGHTSYYYYSYEKELAESIHRHLVTSNDLKDRGVRYGDYFVTRENANPAVLLELGYLSNPNEEGVIKTKKYRESVTTAIVKGLTEYFK